jgi:hypothetical protein
MKVKVLGFDNNLLFAEMIVTGNKTRARFRLSRNFRATAERPGSIASVVFDHTGRVAALLQEDEGELSNVTELVLEGIYGSRRRIAILSGIVSDLGERCYFAWFCEKIEGRAGSARVKALRINEVGFICDIRTETPTPTPTPRVRPRTTEG